MYYDKEYVSKVLALGTSQQFNKLGYTSAMF